MPCKHAEVMYAHSHMDSGGYRWGTWGGVQGSRQDPPYNDVTALTSEPLCSHNTVND